MFREVEGYKGESGLSTTKAQVEEAQRAADAVLWRAEKVLVCVLTYCQLAAARGGSENKWRGIVHAGEKPAW